MCAGLSGLSSPRSVPHLWPGPSRTVSLSTRSFTCIICSPLPGRLFVFVFALGNLQCRRVVQLEASVVGSLGFVFYLFLFFLIKRPETGGYCCSKTGEGEFHNTDFVLESLHYSHFIATKTLLFNKLLDVGDLISELTVGCLWLACGVASCLINVVCLLTYWLV